MIQESIKMHTPKFLIPFALSAAVTWPAMAQQSAHVHGIADVNLAIEGDELEIEFISPSEGIVGFEYEPSTHAEKHAVEDAIALLRKPSNLFDLPATADCHLHEVEAERHAEGDHDDHDGHKDEHAHEDHDDHDDHKDEHAHDDHNHDGHDEEVHSEFHAHYHFDCANPSAITEIGLTLFKTWPGIEKVRVQALTASGQTGGNIEAKDPVIRLQ